MTIHISIAISITSQKRFCRRKSISADCNTSCFGDFESTLFTLTDSINNCYHLLESGHYAEKDDDDSWDKKGLLCGTIYQERKLKSTLQKQTK